MASELARVGTRYSDVRGDLEEHPLTGDVSVATNAEAVKRAVKNLLLTGPYERPFRPNIGSGLQKYLFENANPVTAELIRGAIVTTIENFEPRAKLISVQVRLAPDDNAYEAIVHFGIVNLAETITLTQIIRRIR